jgi:hypothetical protein
MRMWLRILLLACLGYTGCTPASSSKKPIEVNKMKQVMWDLMKADEWYNQITAKDSTLHGKKEDIHLYEQVFAVHGISKDQFYTSYKYYESHPVEFKVLIDSVDALSLREKNKLYDKLPPGQAH